MQMHIEIVETSQIINNPSDEDIAKVIVSTSGGAYTGIILEKRRGAFMQTTFEPDRGYALEYMDEETRYLYHTHWITAKEVIKAMQTYANGDDWWKNNFDWQFQGDYNPDNKEISQ